MACCWSQAPADILWKIIECLPLVDYIRFGAVCVSWRAALAEKRCSPEPEIPWLLVPGDCNSTSSRFINLSEDNKEYHIELPLQGHKLIGSSNGWLASADDASELHIFNPITKTHIRLPSITTLPHIVSMDMDNKKGYLIKSQMMPYWVEESNLRERYFVKVVTSPPLLSRPSNIFPVYSLFCDSLVYANEGDESWTVIETPISIRNFTDLIFYKEHQHLCALSRSGRVLVWDLTSWHHPIVNPSIRQPPAGLDKDIDARLAMKYLVESSNHDLWQIWWLVGFKICGKYGTLLVKVFKMEEDDKWVELESLGYHALFLGYNYSLALSVVDFPELRRNCIYFAENEFFCRKHTLPYEVGLYTMEDQLIRVFRMPESEFNIPPLWFAPSSYNCVIKRKWIDSATLKLPFPYAAATAEQRGGCPLDWFGAELYYLRYFYPIRAGDVTTILKMSSRQNWTASQWDALNLVARYAR